jgi:glycosyltransferase involved in cell wall biosynthesis
MTVIIDETHLGRRASGIERVTEALFSREALAPLDVQAERSGGGRLALLMRQTFALPAKAVAQRRSIWVFPGFPPSPAFTLLRERAVLYVHDIFLITRKQDLNLAGRHWLARNFRLALGRFKYFMANSLATADALRPFLREDAQVTIYRPSARNVFGLTPRPAGAETGAPLILGAIGTIEPRKNFPAAALIRQRLEQATGRRVELHIVGRQGWGDDYDRLMREPGVKLHGYLSDEAARAVIGSFDMLLCTSHDEGLCLPLLEAQFGGLQVVAPDQPVFREVLGRSGIVMDPADPDRAARSIAASLDRPDWRAQAAVEAAANIERWNAAAAKDRDNAIAFLSGLSSEIAPCRAA